MRADWRVAVGLVVLVHFAAPTTNSQALTECRQVRVEARNVDGKPAIAANVETLGPGCSLSDRRDSSGNARFAQVRPGTYRVSVSKDGYTGLSQGVEVSIGETVTLEFTLRPLVVDSQTSE